MREISWRSGRQWREFLVPDLVQVILASLPIRFVQATGSDRTGHPVTRRGEAPRGVTDPTGPREPHDPELHAEELLRCPRPPPPRGDASALPPWSCSHSP